MLASVQKNWRGSKLDYDAVGVRVETEHRLSRQTTMRVRGSLHDRRFRTRKFLDGSAAELSLSGTRVITQTARVNAELGWSQDRTKQAKWRNKEYWLQTGIDVALRRGFSWSGSIRLRWTDFEGNWFPNTPFNVSRDDRTDTLRTSVHHRAYSWNGFSPQLSLVHEKRKTNAQLYDYKRTGIELGFVRLF